MYTKMLIPLDGSKTAEKVLPYARYLAGGKFKIPVELLAVIDIAEMATHISAEKVRHLDTMIEDAVRASTTYLRGVATTFRDAKVTCTVEKDRAEGAIISKGEADTAVLIAMATHGRSGLNRFLLGSVTEKVLRGSRNPLFLVRAHEEGATDGAAMIKSIVAPLDGSELAESVLPTVMEVAKTLDLEVVLCRAYELAASAYYGSEDYLPDYDEMRRQIKAEAEGYLAEKADALKAAGLARVSWVALEGSGAEEFVRYTHTHRDALVAMCTHGRSGINRWVLGSVTERVVRHSDGPVLVVHAG